MKLMPWIAREHSGTNGLRNGLAAKAKRKRQPESRSKPDILAGSTMRKLMLLVALVAFALSLFKQYPEIRRYLRMESM